MADEYKNDSSDEEDEFKTPIVREKKKKKKITSETEDLDEDGKMTITVEEISEQPDRMAPIVAYFSSGYDPFAKSDDGESEMPKVTVYGHKVEARKRTQVVVSPPNSTVQFIGTNFSGEGAARQTCVYKLGILDKETRTLKIVPIARNKIFRLEPRVKSREAEASGSAATPELSQGERLTKLNKHFGTKDAISRDKKRHALNLGDDPEDKEFLESKLDKVNVNESALESTSSVVARNIPPYDASATTPEEVYPLQKIIEKGLWNFLQDVYRLLEQDTEAATDAYPLFVRNRLDMLRDTKDETERQTLSVILSFITHLIKFNDMNSMNGFESAKDHKFPGIIRQKLTSLFKDLDSVRMPDDKRALLISYVLVLTLHVDKFKSDPEDIGKDLRLNRPSVRKHFEELGCKMSREKTGLCATLPVPLKFPQPMRKRPKRG